MNGSHWNFLHIAIGLPGRSASMEQLYSLMREWSQRKISADLDSKSIEAQNFGAVSLTMWR